MCGRYTAARTDDDIAADLRVQQVVGEAPAPSWNVAPTQRRRVVVERAAAEDADDTVSRQLRSASWGLIPSWAKDPKIGSRLINARSETILSKPSFRAAATRRRALVPGDGYYEWEKIDGKKVPHYLHHPAESLLAFAGLYELWPDPDKDSGAPDHWRWSYTVITRPAQDSLGHIHDRAPVVVPADRWAEWLDPTLGDKDAIAELIDSIPHPTLVPREVSSEVNSVRNNGPNLVQPAG